MKVCPVTGGDIGAYQLLKFKFLKIQLGGGCHFATITYYFI